MHIPALGAAGLVDDVQTMTDCFMRYVLTSDAVRMFVSAKVLNGKGCLVSSR
jgi:hypothetical protein